MKKYFALLAIGLLAGCSSMTNGGGHSAGGTSSTVDGVEVWKGGGPGRPYTVVKTVSRTGADTSTEYAQQEASIAHQAQKEGADAVIIKDEVMVVARMDIALGRPVMAPKVDAELIKYQ